MREIHDNRVFKINGYSSQCNCNFLKRETMTPYLLWFINFFLTSAVRVGWERGNNDIIQL